MWWCTYPCVQSSSILFITFSFSNHLNLQWSAILQHHHRYPFSFYIFFFLHLLSPFFFFISILLFISLFCWCYLFLVCCVCVSSKNKNENKSTMMRLIVHFANQCIIIKLNSLLLVLLWLLVMDWLCQSFDPLFVWLLVGLGMGVVQLQWLVDEPMIGS